MLYAVCFETHDIFVICPAFLFAFGLFLHLIGLVQVALTF